MARNSVWVIKDRAFHNDVILSSLVHCVHSTSMGSNYTFMDCEGSYYGHSQNYSGVRLQLSTFIIFFDLFIIQYELFCA